MCFTLCNYYRKQSVFRANDARWSQKRVGLLAESPIPSGSNQNWNVSTNFSEISPYQILWKSAQPFSSCYMRTDRHTHKVQAISEFLTAAVTNALQTRTCIHGLCQSARTIPAQRFTPYLTQNMHKISLASKHHGQDNFIFCSPKAWNFICHIMERTQRWWERGRTSCVPRCLFRVYQLCPELSTARLRKCISWVPMVLLDVSYSDTTKPTEQAGKRTGSAARDTHTRAHTHTHTHHPSSKVSTFSTTM